MSEAPQPPPPDRPPSETGGSRNLWKGVALGAGVVVLAVVLFVALRPDDGSEPAADTTPTLPTTTGEETTTEATTEETTTAEEPTTEEATTTAPPENQPTRVRIVVRDALPVGGVQEHEVDEGDRVVLIVRADVEDEVHLHGYDLPADVAPGQPARITFTANLVGEFEIELEERGEPIGTLVVS